MRCIQKVSKLKLYFPRPRWTINEIFIFFRIVLFRFNILIPVSFLLVKAFLKLFLIWYEAACFSLISFKILLIPNFASSYQLGLKYADCIPCRGMSPPPRTVLSMTLLLGTLLGVVPVYINVPLTWFPNL